MAKVSKSTISKKRNGKTHSERCAGTVLPIGGFQHPKGWNSQCGQVGGKPAVARYKGGELRSATYLTGSRESLPAAIRYALPSHLKWQGTRANFRVLGQVRNGAFEAIAIVMSGESTLVANLTDSLADTAIHNGFITTARAKRRVPITKLPDRTLLISTYSDVVRIAWFNRVTGKVIKRIKLDRI